MLLGIAYGLGNVFNDIRGETSACAHDGSRDVPKTDRDRCPSYAQLIYPMLKHRIIHVGLPTRCRLLVLHFEYTLVCMKESLELKSHYALNLFRMLQGQHVLVSSQH